jgi:hypothetical protein
LTEDKLAFFDETSEAPEVEETPEAVEAEAAEDTGEEQAPPPVAAEEKTREIPVTALLDEREKRQAAQRDAENARRELAAIRQQIAAQQKTAQQPDFYANPEAVLQSERAQVQQVIWNERLNTSELMAAQAYGVETVEAAKVAFMQASQSNPVLGAELQTKTHPYDYVVKWHKQQSVLRNMGDDPEAYINAQVEARLQERLSQASVPKPTAPPASLARAPAKGTDPKSPGSTFDAMFTR